MKLLIRMTKEDNENIAAKIIEVIEKTKTELKPYLEVYAVSKWQDDAKADAEKNDTVKKIITTKDILEITSNENLVDDHIKKADTGNARALISNLNLNETSSNLKKDTKIFFSDATKIAISNLKIIEILIKNENYADALEHLIKANKAIGCLEATKKLDLTKKLFSAEIQKKVDAAHASHLLKPEAIFIVLSLAEMQRGSFSTREELFEIVGYACYLEIKKQLGEKAIRGNEFNFAQTLMKHAGLDKEFGERIDLLIKKRNGSANLQSVWSSVNVER